MALWVKVPTAKLDDLSSTLQHNDGGRETETPVDYPIFFAWVLSSALWPRGL